MKKRPHITKKSRKIATTTPTVRSKKPLPASTLAPGLERLERYLAHSGAASRREAKGLITTGQVLVNNKKITEPGYGINPSKDTISINGNPQANKESILFYKPRGIETSATVKGAADIASRYSKFAHLSPIGRLDKDSDGLIILSNDGTLARALTQENSHVEKEYLVETREVVTDTALQRMAQGIKLDGVMTQKAQTSRKGRTSFTIVLTEGRKHQIRRMCDACRLTITSLTRIRIGHLKKASSMIPGNYKPLTEKDVLLLKSTL
jgi:pseudouridine synthase